VFEAGRSPLVGLPLSSKPRHPSTAPTSAIHVSAPLLGFGPLQRSTALGARMTRRDPLLRHHPPSGFRTLSTVFFAQNHAGLVSSPLRSWGSRGRLSGARHTLSGTAGRRRPRSLSKAFSSLMTNACYPRSPLACFIGADLPVDVAGSSHNTSRVPFPGTPNPMGTSESRSQESWCIPKERPRGTSLLEVCSRPSCS
jgi:hypothetical protein